MEIDNSTKCFTKFGIFKFYYAVDSFQSMVIVSMTFKYELNLIIMIDPCIYFPNLNKNHIIVSPQNILNHIHTFV